MFECVFGFFFLMVAGSIAVVLCICNNWPALVIFFLPLLLLEEVRTLFAGELEFLKYLPIESEVFTVH